MGLSAITLALAKKYSERIIAEKTAAIDQAILDAIKESKFYTDTVASQLISFNIKIADTLPSESEASEHTLYLIKKENILLSTYSLTCSDFQYSDKSNSAKLVTPISSHLPSINKYS